MKMFVVSCVSQCRIAVVRCFSISCVVVGMTSVGHADEPSEPVAAAIVSVLSKNIGHAREWLDQKDYKSLAQSAGGLVLLADILQARGDNAAWQQATDKVIAAAREVQAAARQENAAQCQASLDGLDKVVAAAAIVVPSGSPRTIEKPPAIRSLMLTMDAIQADGKIALLTGNAAAAKKQAFVLSELGKLVSNSRTTEQWSGLSDNFVKATLAAATTTENDPKAVRQLFRAIAERCEACHETRGR